MAKEFGESESVMTATHKETLQMCRDKLVENMIPDDLFNHLIANKILTQADVGRIKEKNTREAMNEELVNNLVLRSDRAFSVFVTSLHKTLQSYLADILEKYLLSKQDQQKLDETKKQCLEKTGENSRVKCTNAIGSGSFDNEACECQLIGEEVREMLESAFCNITRKDDSQEAFETFKEELSQTNILMKETLQVMNVIKAVCQHERQGHGSGHVAPDAIMAESPRYPGGERTQNMIHVTPDLANLNCVYCEQIQQIKAILNEALIDTDEINNSHVYYNEENQVEISQKHKLMKDSLEIIAALKALCQHAPLPLGTIHGDPLSGQ